MALKDTWKDFQDAVEGVPDSGDMASVEPINEIAHAVIELEKDKGNGETVDLSNYYTKDEVEEIADEKEDISNKCEHMYNPNQINYPTTQAVWDLVQEETARLVGMIIDVETRLSGQIGDIDTAINNIIAKYGLGGDAS